MHRLKSKVFLATISIWLALFTGTAQAQPRRAATPSAVVPSPRSVLGFTPGDDRTIADWKQIADYFTRLDKASDRVQVQTIGQSTLGRTMIAAFISAPENIRNLDKYKAIQARLADPRKVAGDAERDQLLTDAHSPGMFRAFVNLTNFDPWYKAFNVQPGDKLYRAPQDRVKIW